MNILVTGGSGFIGSNFIIYWLKKNPGDKIVNLDLLTYAGNRENLVSVEGHPGYRFVKGDINNLTVVDRLVKGIDVIVHFAAETHVDRSINDPAAFIKTNITGTHILLKAALKHKVKKFHHISTDEVYGSLSLGEKKKFNEDSPYRPASPYAASKAASDHLVNAFHKTYGLPITVTNCSNNYGPLQHPEKFIPLIITNALENKKIPIYGDGANVRDWLYVEDHCIAIGRVLKNGIDGHTYCVGGLTGDISNLEIAGRILDILKKSRDLLAFVHDRPGHDRRYAIDWTKIKRELDWTPQHSLDRWLEKTCIWYQENENWWKKLKNRNFDRYYKKQYPQGL